MNRQFPTRESDGSLDAYEGRDAPSSKVAPSRPRAEPRSLP